MFSFKNFLRSLSHAMDGVKKVYFKEQSFRIQIIAGVLAIALALVFKIKPYEWLAVLTVSGVVLSLEILNSMLEKTLDVVNTQDDPRIKYVKDLSAAAVLIASITALIIGVIIFSPYIFF